MNESGKKFIGEVPQVAALTVVDLILEWVTWGVAPNIVGVHVC